MATMLTFDHESLKEVDGAKTSDCQTGSAPTSVTPLPSFCKIFLIA